MLCRAGDGGKVWMAGLQPTICALSALLIATACSSNPQPPAPPGVPLSPVVDNLCGSGTSSSWQMQNTATGSLTQLECSIRPQGESWGCYTSSGGGSGAVAELDYTKTDTATYWNPGLPQNLKWFLYNDPSFGWKPIIAYVVDFNPASVTTVYYYPIPPGSAGEPLFKNATDSKIGWLSTTAYDNTCQPYPGEVPPAPQWQAELIDGGYQYSNGPWRWLTGRWSTTINLYDTLPCDGLVDYCGPAISLLQHEGSYDDYTVGTWEKWWFSKDPSGATPRMLKKVEQTEFDGTPDALTIETTSTTLGRALLPPASSRQAGLGKAGPH